MMTTGKTATGCKAARIIHRMRRFVAEKRASVAVEMAFILPIFASMAFLTYDAGTIYSQYNRGAKNLYSIGDIVSSQTEDLTCQRLDRIAELVYESYAIGNWARRERSGGDQFDHNGALDFRFTVRMIRADEQPDGSIKGYVEWAYKRDEGAANAGYLTTIPASLQIDDMRFVELEGDIWVAPAMNYMGIFDLDPGGGVSMKIDVDRYFPLRFVPAIDLVEKNGDRFTQKCVDDG